MNPEPDQKKSKHPPRGFLSIMGNYWIVHHRHLTPFIIRRIEVMQQVGYLKEEARAEDNIYLKIIGGKKQYQDAVEILMNETKG